MTVDRHIDFYDTPAPTARRGIDLTARELQILGHVAEGRSYGEIGAKLFISRDTVKTHAKRLFRKLDATGRAHAVAQAFRRGVLP